MKRFFQIIIIFIFIAIILSVPEILSAAQNVQKTTMPTTGFAAFWIMLAIVYLSRKRAIGGWLLYYYCCLYAGILFTVLMSIPFINNLSPSDWGDKTLYLFYLASTIPSDIALILEMIFATKLLFKKKRNLSNVNVLRYILIIAVVFNLIGLFIDAKYFDENIILSVWYLITSIIWCGYFYLSERVFWVLLENKWDYDEFSKRKNSPEIITDQGSEDVKNEARETALFKKCPFCGESIQSDALKCRHCRKWLTRS